MIRQIKYFQAVVRRNSFSEAAEEYNISQSAVSQQLQALERELGFQLLWREKRKFRLTPAGEHFYKKSLILIADYERICAEAAKIARAGEAALRIGCLRGYGGDELRRALDIFSSEYPEVSVKIEQGSHEELFCLLRTGAADLVFNDQRRAFSDEYVNFVLRVKECCIELAARSPMAGLERVTAEDLKNTPCILVAPEAQRGAEEAYYREVMGVCGELLFAESLEEARLLIAGGNGYMIGCRPEEGAGPYVRHIPLFRGGAPLTQTYCAFWKKDNSGYYLETFADILRAQFERTGE